MGVINGGTFPYVVAEEATIKVDCRISTKENGDIIIKKFNEIATNAHIGDVVLDGMATFIENKCRKFQSQKSQ